MLMQEMAARLEALAERARRLGPSHVDPEKFHEEKSELARDLSALADQARSENMSGTLPADRPRRRGNALR